MADAQLLTDIRLRLQDHRLRPVYSVETEDKRAPNRSDVLTDFSTISGRDNLGQAVIIRLLTPAGELALLGHPEFGSRLHELIGRQNTSTNRNLVKLFILESLQLEPRINKIVSVTVTPADPDRLRVNVEIVVQPVGPVPVVTIGPFTLELQP